MEIKNKIEVAYNEYMGYKYILEELDKQQDKNRESVANQIGVLKGEELYSYMFDITGKRAMIIADLRLAELRLLNYVTIADTVIDVPKEIKDLAEKINQEFIYTPKGELVNEDIYNNRKNTFIENMKAIEKQQ